MYRLLPMICGVLLIGKSLALAAPPMAPAELPGNGLARHPFFYAGEDKVQSMFLVKDGKIAWSHTMPNSKGEISDAFLRANGNILFAHQFGITEVSPQKTIVWHLDAPRGCEIHTAQPLSGERVMYVQNGDPARLKVVSKVNRQGRFGFHPAGQAAQGSARPISPRPDDGAWNIFGGPHGHGQSGRVRRQGQGNLVG